MNVQVDFDPFHVVTRAHSLALPLPVLAFLNLIVDHRDFIRPLNLGKLAFDLDRQPRAAVGV
jgi:hypothetical protein